MITSIQSRANVGRVLTVTVLVVALAAFLMLAATPSYASTTFYVNSTSDRPDANLGAPDWDTGYTVERDGGGEEAECTLRAAIEQANSTQGADTIKFAIPGTGVKTIAPQS
ncbi:MAG TPA: CSLREA domain-containing protein, partial [Rubrobacter sp.]|nr:CSLREA domain-containing protein [Rubrobacter sp.]